MQRGHVRVFQLLHISKIKYRQEVSYISGSMGCECSSMLFTLRICFHLHDIRIGIRVPQRKIPRLTRRAGKAEGARARATLPIEKILSPLYNSTYSWRTKAAAASHPIACVLSASTIRWMLRDPTLLSDAGTLLSTAAFRRGAAA